jgi:hypothetical protein
MLTTRRRARLAAVVASVLAALILAGCHASTTVAIRVRADGSGTVSVGVTLDRSATVALADGATKPVPLDIPLGDLRARGWSASASAGPDGGTVLAELDGRDGAVRDVQLVRTRALLHDHDSVSALVDLSHLRAGVSDDAALTARLRSAGVDVAALDAGLSARIKGSFDLTVSIVLPDGTRTVVRLEPGQQRTVSVASTTNHSGRLDALVAAGFAAVLGLALFGASFAHTRRLRRS